MDAKKKKKLSKRQNVRLMINYITDKGTKNDKIEWCSVHYRWILKNIETLDIK